MTLTGQMAEQAESIVNTLTQTDYQHSDNIVPAAGIYECDCNGFVGYVLSIVAPRHAALIAPETNPTHPLPYEYFDIFTSRTPDSSGGWRSIDLLTASRAGERNAPPRVRNAIPRVTYRDNR